MAAGSRVGHPRAAMAVAGALVASALAWSLLISDARPDHGLTIVLALCGSLGALTAAQWQGRVNISASFVSVMLAVAYLGPAAAFGIAVFAESVTWVSE